MDDPFWLLLALLLAYGCALSVGPLLRPVGWFSLVAAACAVVALYCLPLLVPAEQLAFRVVVVFLATDLVFRITDFTRHVRQTGEVVSFREYCRFLTPFPVLLVVFSRNRRRVRGPLRWPFEAARVLAGGIGFAIAFVLLLVLQNNEFLRSSFLLDHAVKVPIFVFGLESMSRALNGLERLMGCDTTPIIENTFLSRTVLEFWTRWNRRGQAWFYYNVFLTTGGRRAPVRGVFLTFFASAVLHELGFGIATSRFDGYQFAFFMIQAPVVLTAGMFTRLSRKHGIAAKVLSHAFTILWMWLTSMLFLHGVNRIFSFYYTSEPWLP